MKKERSGGVSPANRSRQTPSDPILSTIEDGLDVDEIFDPDRNALITLDRQGRVQSIIHVGKHWRVDEPTAKAASANYVRLFAPILKLPPEWLSDLERPLSYLRPLDQGVKYQFSEEKPLQESTTIGYTQTILNVPVWGAGLTVTMKHGPYRVVHAAHTGHVTPSAKLPPRSLIDRYLRLFAIADEERRRRDTDRREDPNGPHGRRKSERSPGVEHGGVRAKHLGWQRTGQRARHDSNPPGRD